MAESQGSSSVPGETKRRKVRSRGSREDAAACPERGRRCFTPEGQPEECELRLPAHWALPQLTQDMRQQEEETLRGAAHEWASSFGLEVAALPPVWRHFWAFAHPRALVLMGSKMYLGKDSCFRHLMASVLASALWFAAGGAAGGMELRGAAALDDRDCSSSAADFVFHAQDRRIVLVVATRRSDLSYHQNAGQLWRQMFEASGVNRRRGAASTAVAGILQDLGGAVAFRLVDECSAAGAGTAGAAPGTSAADPPVTATQMGVPSGSVGDQPEADQKPAGSQPEAGISCSPYMSVFSSDGRPSSGIAAWSTLLLTTLNPECRAWSEEQAGRHGAQLEERAKREHCTFLTQLEHVTA